MIDFNNPEQIKEIKKIVNHPNWELFQEYVEYEINKLKDIETIKDENDLHSRRYAVSLLRKILTFVNN